MGHPLAGGDWNYGDPIPTAYCNGHVGNKCDKCGYRFVVLICVKRYLGLGHSFTPSPIEFWCKTCVENNG